MKSLILVSNSLVGSPIHTVKQEDLCPTYNILIMKEYPTSDSLCLFLIDVVNVHFCQGFEEIGFRHHSLGRFPGYFTDTTHHHNALTHCLHCFGWLGKGSDKENNMHVRGLQKGNVSKCNITLLQSKH